MLAYLAVRHEARREELVDLLWGGVAEANARNAFRQALHRLRSALGDDLLPADRDKVVLVPSSVFEADRDRLLVALDRDDVASASELYRGDFLDGFDVGETMFDSWAAAERLRLRTRFQAALQKGAETALANGRWLEALQLVQRLSLIAPFEESAALLEANVLVAAGRGPEALASLRRFAQVLRDQLDVQPSARITDLVTRLERSGPTASPGPNSSSSRHGFSVPFVGREPEIAKAMGAMRALAEERGATIQIDGAIGIGKTRFVEEVLNRARSTGPILVLRGRERPLGTSLPYASVGEALRGLLKASGVSGTGRHLLAEASRILPELRDAFDLPTPTAVEDEGGRLRFFEGVAALIDAVAYEQPTCLVLDDLHNASPATLDLLSYLAARLQASPVVLVLVYRREAAAANVAKQLSAISADDHGGRLMVSLGELDPDGIRRIVSSVVGSHGVEDQIDLDRVSLTSAGNPLRAIELARSALNGEQPPSTPQRLRDVLWAQFQRTSPSQRRIFFAAALLQRRAPLRLLAAAAHLPESAAFEAAQNLEAAGFLAQEGDGYVVAHDFTLGFVSEASGLAGRALLAGWAADALASEPDATSLELAHLYSTAGQPGPAFEHARRAAYEAAVLGATTEVQRLFDMAAALAPDPESRAAIQRSRGAFGSGQLLLPAPESAAAADRGPHENAPPVDEPPKSRPAPTPSHARVSFATARLYVLTAILIASTALLVWRRSVSTRAGQQTLGDSLVLIERGANRGGTVAMVTGALDNAAHNLQTTRSASPRWSDSLSLPWINPRWSPNGRYVAVERMTETGTDVFLLGRDTTDRSAVAVGGGNDEIMGWAPDGSAVLVRRARTLADGSYDADLWAYQVLADRSVRPIPIDTSADRAVREAQWSPDGTRIAWVAQVGPTHQQDVFVGLPDGSSTVNLTASPTDDYHIAWSADGNLLAFTSDRRGNPDLFAYEFEGENRRLWSLTSSQYAEDHASFSPDDRYVAFQSTRDSDAAVYVMPALGGRIVKVTPPGRQFSIGGWRGSRDPTFVDRFRLLGPSTAKIGDSVSISVLGIDRAGVSRLPDSVRVTLLDQDIAQLAPGDGPHRYTLRAKRAGTARISASIPGWRYDTLAVRLGSAISDNLADDFVNGIDPERWTALGIPLPFTRAGRGSVALYPNGDSQWESGVLSRAAVSLTSGARIAATLSGPFNGRPISSALLDIAFVADGPIGDLNRSAPQLTKYVSVAWDGEATRFIYSVGAESKSDPISELGAMSSHRIAVMIDSAGTVTFQVDDRVRWKSSIRFLGTVNESRARVWLGGRATGAVAFISQFKLTTP